jgi:hypothetical protein
MRKFLLPLSLSLLLFSCKEKTEQPAKDEAMVKSSATKETPQSEFADAKYSEWGKQRMQQFQNGDIDGWASQFADDAVYSWSSGDSLAGKKAIIDYWKNRRKNVIQSISFTNDIWLPIKVNRPQKGPDAPGIWMLNWYQVDATYNTGKKLSFWVHTDSHFNSNDQVDRVIQYIDRAPINAAMMK